MEDAVLAQIKRFGGDVPDRVTNAPRLQAHLGFYLDAFNDLTTERAVIPNFDPIPWSAIVAYAGFYGLCGDACDDLLYLIRRADNAYLKRLANRQR